MNYEKKPKKDASMATSLKTVRRNSQTQQARLPPPHLHTQHPQHYGELEGEHYPLQSQPYSTLDAHHTYIVNEPLSLDHPLPPTDRFGHFVSEHEINFEKTEVCVPSTCICFFLALLFSFMAIMSGVYFGLNFFDGKHVKERVFKVQFIAHNPEYLASELRDIDSKQFKIASNGLKRMLDQLFNEAGFSKSYIKTEIIAFERKRSTASDVMVHLNVYFSSNRQMMDSSQLYLLLAEEILNSKYKAFKNVSIDYNSLDVQERKPSHASLSNPWTYKTNFPGMLEGLSTQPTPASRKCVSIGLGYCRFLGYKQTSYPNLVEHWNLSSVEEDFLTYKEIIDSECYSLANDFLCNLLQPECVEDELIMPCRDYCHQFVTACGRWLPETLLSRLVCTTLPEASIKGKQRYYECRRQPNCSSSLVLQRQDYKLCDGVVDCADGSDEFDCSYCATGHSARVARFDCGNAQCVDNNVTCDGSKDCANGADEHQCLRLVSNVTLAPMLTTSAASTLAGDALGAGFLLARFKGRQAFVCSEMPSARYNESHSALGHHLHILGSNVCKEMQFEQMHRISSRRVASSGPFTRFVPGTTLISPYSTSCSSGEVYYVECSVPKCGLTPMMDESELSLYSSRVARPGYWPWYVKINVNDNYACDGTLVSTDAVLVQGTCLDAGGGHDHPRNVTIVLASSRFNRDNIEARHYSPLNLNRLESSGLEQRVSIIKLNKSIDVSVYARPVCHNANDLNGMEHERLKCVLLQLNYDNDQLQHRLVNIVPLEQCRSANETTTRWGKINNHGRLCVESFEMDSTAGGYAARFDRPDCGGEPCVTNSGRHLYCRVKHSWHLVGIESGQAQVTQPANSKSRRLILFEVLTKLLTS